jgi:hypothetical protein
VFRPISETIWESIGWATKPAKKQKKSDTTWSPHTWAATLTDRNKRNDAQYNKLIFHFLALAVSKSRTRDLPPFVKLAYFVRTYTEAPRRLWAWDPSGTREEREFRGKKKLTFLVEASQTW